jgi:glycine cleavage system H protein
MVQTKQYQVPTDRLYEPNSNMWAQPDGVVVRIGFDELGQETHGDIAFLQLATPGTTVCRRQELGSLEAGKYVGPILSPVSGTVSAVNQRALDDPRLVNTDPYGDGWLVEIALADSERCEHLLREPLVISRWFNDKVREFREKGVLAE